MRRAAMILVLLCATTHCVLSIFYVNTSYLNLHDYASGTAPEPFQRRYLMVPLLHWAEQNPLLQSVARRYGRNVPQAEPMTPAKLVCVLAGLLLLNGFGLWTLRASRQLRLRHVWLLWALLLAILYASYGARYEQSLWYPYDIPHVVLFGLATAWILLDCPLAFACAFLIDAPLRETAIFLIPVALAVHWRSRKWLGTLAFCVAFWGVTRAVAYHLYPNGAHQWNAVRWYSMLKPWHLPQLVSIAGFLWLPVWLGAGYLHRRERMALYGASAMMLVTFFFATWNETRAWSEWSFLFAALAALELERAFRAPQATLDDLDTEDREAGSREDYESRTLPA